MFLTTQFLYSLQATVFSSLGQTQITISGGVKIKGQK